MNKQSRRSFLRAGTAAALTPALLTSESHAAYETAASAKKDDSPLAGLKSITGDVERITDAERQKRRDKLSRLLGEQKTFGALIEPGSSLYYFTGVQWSLSERLTAGLLTANGDLLFITPAFEESRLREMAGPSAEVIIWQEDENPFEFLAAWMKERVPGGGTLALDEAIRYFAAYRLGLAAPDWTLRSAAEEVNACRMIKSAAEIALMKSAADITVAAYKAIYPLVSEGMSGPDITALMQEAQTRLGGERVAGGTQVDKGSALPHGSREPEYVREGSMILMDFGCGVDGYRSDISRTFVFGEASAEQRALFDLNRRGQDLAFATAKVGTPAGDVDRAVRQLYESEGFGPGYEVPGLSHRLGHGIGLDGHEPINFVGNETTPLQSGMCFSNEPGLYVPGKYGMRIEDCIYITESGPRWFSEPPKSLDKPMG